MSLFKSSKLVYVEIHENKISVSKVSKNLKTNPVEISYQNLEICDGRIFNIKKVAIDLEKYSEEYDLKNPAAILALPILADQKEIVRPFLSLEAMICLSFAKFRTIRIVDQTLNNLENINSLKNYLDSFRAPKNTNPYLFIFLTSLIFGSTLFATFKIQKLHSSTLSSFISKNSSAEAEVKQINQDLAQAKKLEEKIKSLELLIKNLSTGKKRANAIGNLLSIFSEIPNDTVLLSIKIEKSKPKNSKSSQIAFIEGISINTQDISKIVKRLKESPFFEKTKLLNVEKTDLSNKPSMQCETKDQKQRFIFKISSKIKNQKNS